MIASYASTNSIPSSPPISGESTPWFIPELDPRAAGFNCAELIAHWGRATPTTKALCKPAGRHHDGRARFDTLTFGELDAKCSNYAHVLSGLGLKPGDRAALFIDDGTEFVALTYALQRMGAVPVLIDPGMGVPNLKACLAEQKLRAFIGIPKAHALRLIARASLPHLEIPVVVGKARLPFTHNLHRLVNELPDHLSGAPYPHFQGAPDAAATLVYTSGSTGIPKGVIYTHRMMAGQVAGVAHVGGFTPGETHVACFPGFALYAVGCGMTTVFPEMDFTKPAKANPKKIIEAMDAFDAKSAFASPALWETFSRYVEKESCELPRIRAFFASGAAVQPALLERILPAIPSGDMFTPYGATESLPVAYIGGREILARTAPLTREGKGTCVGRIAPDIQVRIIRITDDVIPHMGDDILLEKGEIGEIAVCGTVVTEVYDQRPEHTARAKMRDDRGRVWHRMGDVGYIGDDGNLWFCGRKSHRVETEQGTLFSVPCEALFEVHPDVARAALTWVGDKPKQTPVMCVELRPGVVETPKLVDELMTLAAENPLTRDIDHVLVHPGFPVDRRHNAKIEREKLSDWAKERIQ